MKQQIRTLFATLLPLVCALYGYGQHVIYPSFDTEGPKWEEKNTGNVTDIKYSGNKYVENVTIYGVVDLGVTVTEGGRTYHVDVLTHNIGAEHNYDSGDYYAWGELEPYYKEGDANAEFPEWREGKEVGYDWDSYRFFKWLSVGENRYIYTIKYCTLDLIDWAEVPKRDGKAVLDPEDDIATQTFGDKFAIPTQAEWRAIYDQCYWAWTDNYDNTGKGGFIIYKSMHPDDKHRSKKSPSNVTYNIKTDIHVFLPCACNRFNLDICGNPYILEEDVRYDVYYWSSTLGGTHACDAVIVFMRSGPGDGNVIFRDFVRSTGTPIRAIRRRY